MKLWGGRFTKNTNSAVESFHSSISFDSKMYKEDICGSIAHAQMLGKQGIISPDEAKQIVDGLNSILADIEAGNVEFTVEAEDIHMNVETILTERIGATAKKLHTGRSRNDQVALDMRMYTMNKTKEVQQELKELMSALLDIASSHTSSYMPGYTHLQKAQPITLAHHLMAYFNMFKRDYDRLNDWHKRTNLSPLGSGALAATTYPLDRNLAANSLGFDGITENSLDGVSDRDFVIELCSCLSIIMTHLSRFCEEFILWASNEFSFIELDDGYSTGSSIMPQKKNPDVAELIRGKTGRVYGSLISILTVMKSLPLAYNKDMQEDKEMTFDALETVTGCLSVFTGMLKTTVFKVENMKNAALRGFTNATDVADYLVNKGMPFRDAHAVSGKLVFYCIERSTDLLSLSLDEFKAQSDLFENDVYEAISLETCVEKRIVDGGPSKVSVDKQIKNAKEMLLEI